MRNYFFKEVFVVFLLLLGCSKVEIGEVRNLNDNRVGILGHGGMGLISPENSLPLSSVGSLLKAVEGYNADGVDADVQLSADSVWMLFHDGRLELTTDCQGCISENNAEDLQDCRYRAGFSANVFQNERVSPLEPFLERMSLRPIKPIVFLDVKTNFFCNTSIDRDRFLDLMVRKMDLLIRKFDGADWMWIDSRDLDFLRRLKQANAQIKVIFAQLWSEELIQQAVAEDFFALCLRYDAVSFEEMTRIHDNGLRVIFWDVRDRAGAIEAINKHPDFVITDNIPLMQQLLKN